MRTDHLINALASAVCAKRLSPGPSVTLALAAGIATTTSIFFAGVGFRMDILQAVTTFRFLYKFVIVLSLLVPSIAVFTQLTRPVKPPSHWSRALLVAAALLCVGVVAELVHLRPEEWGIRLVGQNMRNCLTIIPALSAAPLAFLLLALRHGAPANPRLAGSIAGLASGAIAAFLYASNCTDDSPLFVATWYPIAIGMVTFCGGLIGGSSFFKW